jgi:hypothetical protein
MITRERSFTTSRSSRLARCQLAWAKRRDEQMEESAAETDDGFDQRDRTREESAAELDDSFDQRDAQQEREAAGGF